MANDEYLDEDDEEWAYSIDEVGEDADESGLLGGDEDEEDDSRRIEPEIEPGSIDPENVFFVALGVLIAIGTIAYGLGIL